VNSAFLNVSIMCYFLFTETCRQALAFIQSPSRWVLRILSLEVKRWGCEPDHFEFKNDWGRNVCSIIHLHDVQIHKYITYIITIPTLVITGRHCHVSDARSVAGMSLQRVSFHTSSLLMGLVVEKMGLRFVSAYFGFSISIIFHKCFVRVFYSFNFNAM